MRGKKNATGEALGGARPGAGRKAVWFKAQRGEKLIIERETIGGLIQQPELWTVLSVSENEIEFQINNNIIVIRKSESD